MPKLNCYKERVGIQANTVVVDVTARERAVELAEELPLRHPYKARNKAKDAIPTANLFCESGPIFTCLVGFILSVRTPGSRCVST